MEKGTKVRIFHELDREGASAIGVVKQILANGHIKATLDDENHELHTLDNGKVRELTVSPDMFEVIA